jgi:hypothetical protein
MTDMRVLIAMVVLIVGCYIAIIALQRWVSARSKDIVFRDLCDERSKRIEDCVEGEIKNLSDRLKELRETTEKGFTRVEALINKRAE